MSHTHRATRASSSATALAIGIACLAIACSDATAPEKLIGSPTTTSSVAGASATIVSPEDMHGWTFVHDGTGKRCDGTQCRMVAGPARPPLGTGSAELSATNGSEASLQLGAFQGTRLDQVTALRYSTWRSTHDARSQLAVALVLNVKLDLTSQANGDVGQLVFEPARSPGVTIADSTWQGWDARAGLWWLTRQGSHAGAGAAAHPCVQSHPCAWSDILQRYPNIGIAPDGGVLLSARKGADFTGNVDSLVVGVGGVNSVYDFELVAQRVQYTLKSTVQVGAVADQFTADTLFDAGTAITYAFHSRPGRAEPLLVLDDTILIPSSGQLVMDTSHSLQVVSDTAYTYATLTPMERSIADLLKNLLASGDKLEAAKALNSWYVDQVNAGVDPSALAHADEIAQLVVVDPVRDSAAMNAVDDALTGWTVNFQKGWDQIYTSWSRDGDAPASGAARVGSTGSSLAPSASHASTPYALQSPRVTSPAMFSPSTPSRDLVSVAQPDNPREYTRVLYMNGIWSSRAGSWASALMLAKAMYAQPRFGNFYTRVSLFYNPTRSEEMKAWDAAHPCVESALRDLKSFSLVRAFVGYGICRGVRTLRVLTSMDLVESITARLQLAAHWTPTNAQAVGFARAVASYRAQDWHVLAVGHSEGTLLEAQAMQMLPSLEQHPIEVANRCVAVLALAPATRREQYGMDEYHLMGLLAQDDIIRKTLPSGWETVYTPLTNATEVAASSSPDLWQGEAIRIWYGVQIHSVGDTYFGPDVMPIVIDKLTQEHKECLPGSANLQVSTATAPLGTQFNAQLDISNQNSRPLLGRRVQMSNGYAVARIDSMTYRAMVPSDKPWYVTASISNGFGAYAPVTVPVIGADYQLRDEQHSQWDVVGEMNVSMPDGTTWSDVGPAPTTVWDGTVEGCQNQRVRKYGQLGNWREWEMHCSRVYRPTFTRPDSLPTGREMSYSIVHWTTPAGASDSVRFARRTPESWYYYCAGPVPCIASSYLEHGGPVSVVARSGVLAPMAVTSSSASLASVSSPSVRNDARVTRTVKRARPRL